MGPAVTVGPLGPRGPFGPHHNGLPEHWWWVYIVPNLHVVVLLQPLMFFIFRFITSFTQWICAVCVLVTIAVAVMTFFILRSLLPIH
jgi:hypothetical protein